MVLNPRCFCHISMAAVRWCPDGGTAQVPRLHRSSTTVAPESRQSCCRLFSPHLFSSEAQHTPALVRHGRLSSQGRACCIRSLTFTYCITRLSNHSAANAALRVCEWFYHIHRYEVEVSVHPVKAEGCLSNTLLENFFQVPVESLVHGDPFISPGILLKLPDRPTADIGRFTQTRRWLEQWTSITCSGRTRSGIFCRSIGITHHLCVSVACAVLVFLQVPECRLQWSSHGWCWALISMLYVPRLRQRYSLDFHRSRQRPHSTRLGNIFVPCIKSFLHSWRRRYLQTANPLTGHQPHPIRVVGPGSCFAVIPNSLLPRHHRLF